MSEEQEKQYNFMLQFLAEAGKAKNVELLYNAWEDAGLPPNEDYFRLDELVKMGHIRYSGTEKNFIHLSPAGQKAAEKGIENPSYEWESGPLNLSFTNKAAEIPPHTAQNKISQFSINVIIGVLTTVIGGLLLKFIIDALSSN